MDHNTQGHIHIHGNNAVLNFTYHFRSLQVFFPCPPDLQGRSTSDRSVSLVDFATLDKAAPASSVLPASPASLPASG